MQVTIKQISNLIKYNREVSDALATASLATDDVAQGMKAASAWLNEQYDSVSPVGTENIFGGVQTAQTWADDRQRYNEALVEIARIENVLGCE